MFRKLWLICLLLCLSVMGSVNASYARGTTDDAVAQLLSEGWTIVGDGVLQRELRAGEVEHFVFGVQGFVWKLQDLRLQYQRLQAWYRVTPTPELKQAIANHRKEIASTMETIRRARAAEKLGLEDDLKVDCSVRFGYNATAGYRTDVAGVWANASAYFNANCGFAGEVYAYATGNVWVNGGPYNVSVTDGPRSGANVSASAAVNVAGGSPCDSYAYSSVTSNNLNPSSYSMAASNSSCPPPPSPPNVTITSGPYSINLLTVFCRTGTWGASVTGGSGSFSYSWTADGGQFSTANPASLSVCRGAYPAGGFTLQVRVTDNATGLQDTDAWWISVAEPDPCTDACICASPAKVASQPIPCY